MDQKLTPFYKDDNLTLFCGDCLDVLPFLQTNSIDSCITDAPYELGFMGKSWDRSGIAYNVEVWRECLRVLKPGGHLLAFGGSRTYHRLACAIEDAGFEIRDQIQWIYGSGFPKSLDVSKAIDATQGAEREIVGQVRRWGNAAGKGRGGQYANDYEPSNEGAERFDTVTAPATDAAKQWDGWGTALKPAHEPIVLARKPLIGTVAENVLRHGTGGLNVDACRIGTEVETWPISRSYAPGQMQPGHNGNTQATGAMPAGRWPANVIHDGSDEVLAAFPDSDGQQGDLSGHSKDRLSKGIFGDMKAARDALARNDFGSAARFFYCAKATQEDRNEGCEDLAFTVADTSHKRPRTELDDPRRAGAVPRQNHHPTIKPTSLMRYLVRLITPLGGITLDPFAGSGSTGKACALEGMKAILIEKELAYCELAMRRARLRQQLLFT